MGDGVQQPGYPLNLLPCHGMLCPLCCACCAALQAWCPA